MKKITIKKYTSEDYSIWNKFVSNAKNATFLFHRDFMEYHSDRFEDYSLLVFDEKDKLVSILPANKVGDSVYSHQGLTYGGFLFLANSKSEEIFYVIDYVLNFLLENGLCEFILKPVPIFYDKNFSSEIDFYLFLKKAKLYRKDMNLVHSLSETSLISKTKLKKYKKAINSDMYIEEVKDYESFWNKILIPRLAEKHNTKPVHTFLEIKALALKFPENIKQFNAYYEDEIVAGITIFESEKVVKSQYGATTKKGESLRALDFLFLSLINKYKQEGKLFFDMGIVTDLSFKNGYNPGLLKQKEELGCVVFEQNHYSVNLKELKK